MAWACAPDVTSRRSSSTPGAGYRDVLVNQIGPDQDAFFDFYGAEVLPQLKAEHDHEFVPGRG